jgi:hypothetical protein
MCEKPNDENSLHEQARKLHETLKRLLKEISELLDRTKGQDQAAAPDPETP